MKKVLVVVGTRPEAIKMAPVIEELDHDRHHFETRVCATGQHRELLRQTIDVFGYRLDYDLQVMKEDQSLSGLTGRLLDHLDVVLADFLPDCTLVQGDTTTAFAAALAAYYRHSDVGHVEAGLRTHDTRAPFPEEMSRRLVGALADHHFAPTERAKTALLREGVSESRILVCGNTVIDALFTVLRGIKADPPALGCIDKVISGGGKVVLITGHRRENFGHGFQEICRGILALAKAFPDVAFVYPVHLNPSVQGPVYAALGAVENIHLVPPMGYLPFVHLMNSCYLVLTDSGGIQEEAPSLGKPVLVMREVTERPEAVEAGTAKLVGSSGDSIFLEVAALLTNPMAYDRMKAATNPYGDGKAAVRIIEYLRNL